MREEMGIMKTVAAMTALALLAACATTNDDIALDRMFAGESQMSGAALDRAVAEAAKYPFGSERNPVRAAMPPGQRAYLSRLRCGDGRQPAFDRVGSYGVGIYGNILDGYAVDCGAAAPGKVEIFMDMYHAGYVETRPVPGFTIVPQ
jgi:hypothetical protein